MVGWLVGWLVATVMPKIRFQHTYNNIISLENLLEAWKEFLRWKTVSQGCAGIRARFDDEHHRASSRACRQNIFALGISTFQNRRSGNRADIHKASVRDRLLHHALHRKLSPFFAKTFISDSNSCQDGKGTHRASADSVNSSALFRKTTFGRGWVLKGATSKSFSQTSIMRFS